MDMPQTKVQPRVLMSLLNETLEEKRIRRQATEAYLEASIRSYVIDPSRRLEYDPLYPIVIREREGRSLHTPSKSRIRYTRQKHYRRWGTL